MTTNDTTNDTRVRSVDEIEARLDMMREYEPVSAADHDKNRAQIRTLEWVLRRNDV